MRALCLFHRSSLRFRDPARLSLQRVPWGQFPAFCGTVACSDSLLPILPHFVSFAWQYHAAPIVALARSARAPSSPGFVRRSPFRLSAWRRQGLPGSWGISMPACPALGPRRSRAPSQHSALMLPSAFVTTSASSKSAISGLDHTAYRLAVYASQPGLPLDHARLASGWWLALAGRASTRRIPKGVSRCSGHPSSSTKLRLAQDKKAPGSVPRLCHV